ncbi:hypothetical protein [Microterricola pindariensis]|uniref:hypothetical protein n=1 Tax=Microterricola pindariensis TaxID=478010 RepID=UPI001056E7F2|nr:hypothetical protein [Microterricola pindariensis]
MDSTNHGPNQRAIDAFLLRLQTLTVPELAAAATAANDLIRARVTDALRQSRADHMWNIVFATERHRYGTMDFLSDADRAHAKQRADAARDRILGDEAGHFEHAWSIAEAEAAAPVEAALDERDGVDVGAAAYVHAFNRILLVAKACAKEPGAVDQMTTEWLRPGAYAAERAGRVLVVQDLLPAAQFELFASPMRAAGIDLRQL